MHDDAAIIDGLRRGEMWAKAAFFDRSAPHIERIVKSILGHHKHDEIADIIHDTFVQALGSLQNLRDPSSLVGWVQSVAAHTAYKAIRARRARRWLLFWAPVELPDVTAEGVTPELTEAYRRTYELLDRLPADERMAFALRFIEGLELNQVAEMCDVSLATIKRRLAKAEKRFASAAQRDNILREWLEEGGRWTS
ncbi:MAG: RNA polymerase sigma factor [Polyangiaceae bacterium]|nr:RNA polymerase sigma factor [Polyangiaceae bacterium]